MSEIIEKRSLNSKTYNLGDGVFRTDVGGDINHYIEDDGSLQEVNLSIADTPMDPGFTHYYKKNNIRAQINDTTGLARIYPKRNRDDVYIDISPTTPVTVTVQVHHNKYIRIWKDTPNVLYQFILTPKDFKILYKLKNSNAPISYDLNIVLVGLTRQGRQIKFEGNTIMRLPNMNYYDSADPQNEGFVDESIANDVATFGFDHTALGLTYPVFIDPSLTIQQSGVEDAYVQKSSPDSNINDWALSIRSSAITQRNAILSFDFSSLPDNATITSAKLSMYYYLFTTEDPSGDTIEINRLDDNRTDWVETEVTWNDYKSSTAWTSPGGDFTGAGQATTVVPASFGWMQWNVLTMTQYAQANTSKILHVVSNFANQTFNRGIDLRASENVQFTSERPKLEIQFTANVNADASNTLPLLSLSASGHLQVDGSINLPVFTVNALAGALGSINLPMLSLSASGHLQVDGSINLPMLSLSASGHLQVDGSINLPMLSLSASGHLQVDGSINLPVFTVNALAGALGSITLPVFTIIARAFKGSPPDCIQVNTFNNAVTENLNSGFNSMTKFNGVYLVADQNGIYELDDSDADDALYKIKSSVKTGRVSTSNGIKNRLRNAWINYQSDGDIKLVTKADDRITRRYNLVSQVTDGIDLRRVKFERGIKNEVFDFQLENVNGSSFELNSMTILLDPIVSKKR